VSDPSQPVDPSTPAPPPAGPPPGWYADPSGTGGTRWWDGTAWTENLQPPAPAVPPPAVAPPAHAATPAYAGAPAYAAAPAYQDSSVQPRKVGFGEAVKRAFAGWTDYSSRSTVAEYWWFVLFGVIIAIPAYIIMFVAIGSSFTTTTAADGTTVVTSNGLSALGLVLVFLIGVLYVVIFFVNLPLLVRRLHDTDRSGWWYFISLIPFGGIVLLVFTVSPGTPGPNRWGPVPQ
jgi:uncharacterized membrane protein YhaH (DUF805 family)